jgi:hypothetical protein
MAETPYLVDSNVLLRWVKPDHIMGKGGVKAAIRVPRTTKSFFFIPSPSL